MTPLLKMLFVFGFGFFGNSLCSLKVRAVWLKENACRVLPQGLHSTALPKTIKTKVVQETKPKFKALEMHADPIRIWLMVLASYGHTFL